MYKYELLGIGNALVDVLVQCEDEFLERYSLNKGSMTLVDQDRSSFLCERLNAIQEVSGGSCSNTIAGFASLAGNNNNASAAYIGKICDDRLGRVFSKDLLSMGVVFNTVPSTYNTATGRCLVLITPDSQRTMCTFLGAATELSAIDIDSDVIQSSKIIYLEGYLFDPPDAQQAFFKAAKVAQSAGRKVAITLSDGFCVDRHRPAFRDIIKNHIDLLFANEEEIISLYEAKTFDEALEKVKNECEVSCLTRGALGSVVVGDGQVYVIDAEPASRVVDTTGAGDQYAAGFLYGFSRNLPLATCGQIAGIAAAEVISHQGARPVTNLHSLVKGKIG